MYILLILSLAMSLVHSAPVDSNVRSSISEEDRDSKQLLTLADFRKKVGQVIGEELSKVINGAYTIPPSPPPPPPAPTTEAAPVTEEQTIIVYITEPPPAPEEIPQTAAPVAPASEPAQAQVSNVASPAAPEIQPEPVPAAVPEVPAAPPAAAATSAPVETVPEEVTATELAQEISTVEDEDEEETEAPETSTNDPEVEATANANAASANENAETTQAAVAEQSTSVVVEEEGSATLIDVSTLPPPFVGKVGDTTEDDERDVGFTFPPIATVSGSVVEDAFESLQSTEPVPLVPTGSSTTDRIDIDEDDDDVEEEYEYEYEIADEDNRTAKKKVLRIRNKKNPVPAKPLLSASKDIPVKNPAVSLSASKDIPVKNPAVSLSVSKDIPVKNPAVSLSVSKNIPVNQNPELSVSKKNP